jgi:RimJ/RimL family protein N-acetyltransferase
MPETDRLVLRRPRLSDAPHVLRILGDADAMRYTRRLASLRECRRHIAAHGCQRRKTGYGPWVVLDRAGTHIIGFGGLYDDPFDARWGIEVAYHFAPAAWGKGYATELTRFCLELAHQRLGRAEVRAFAHPDNAASRRVLEKTGFEEQRFLPAMNRYLYAHRALTRELGASDGGGGGETPRSHR